MPIMLYASNAAGQGCEKSPSGISVANICRFPSNISLIITTNEFQNKSEITKQTHNFLNVKGQSIRPK
jgi:hypothetical protein